VTNQGARKILWINPVGTDVFDQPMREYLGPFLADGSALDVISLEEGPHDLNYLRAEASVIPDVVSLVERSDADAVIVGCFNDTGVHAAREGCSRLVIGPGEVAHHLASRCGSRWSVLVSERKCIPRMTSVANQYGFTANRVTFRSVGIGVHQFQVDQTETISRLRKAAEEAIQVDMAETIILGCTIQFGMFSELQRMLGIPVIDIAVAALKEAEFLIDLSRLTGWRHSQSLTYLGPKGDDHG